MLDLSAAFDCVDHTILLQRLRIGFGLTDVALKWIVSFLTERTQQIAYNGDLSSISMYSSAYRKAARWDRCYTCYTPLSYSTL